MRALIKEQNQYQCAPHILFVDDDQEDQILLKMAFDKTSNNFSLDFVSSGKEAMDFLRQVPEHKLPDLIVLDYHLPGHNGWHLLQQLNAHERYRKIKKVMLSASSYTDLSRYTDHGNIKHFIKPASLSGLKELATELLHLSETKVQEPFSIVE